MNQAHRPETITGPLVFAICLALIVLWALLAGVLIVGQS